MKADYWEASKHGHDAGPRYFVHYKGWKQSWDEWVPETRILKFTDDNIERQQELIATLQAEKKKAALAAGASSSSAGANGAGGAEKSTSTRKRTRDGLTDREEEFLKRSEIRVPIPDTLKAQLVDDWEYVTKNQQLVSLPRQPNVVELLEEYSELRRKVRQSQKLPADDDELNEVVEGLKVYFDKALGTILLYRQERLQYANIMKAYPGKRMCELYGAEHLLRLFVQLPRLIAHTTMDADSIKVLKEHLYHILLFLQKNLNRLFLVEYENASPDYIES